MSEKSGTVVVEELIITLCVNRGQFRGQSADNICYRWHWIMQNNYIEIENGRSCVYRHSFWCLQKLFKAVKIWFIRSFCKGCHFWSAWLFILRRNNDFRHWWCFLHVLLPQICTFLLILTEVTLGWCLLFNWRYCGQWLLACSLHILFVYLKSYWQFQRTEKLLTIERN